MNVLIKMHNSPEQRFFVRLREEDFLSNVREFICKKKYDEAIRRVFNEADYVDELAKDEKEEDFLEAVNLILTSKSADYNTPLTTRYSL